MLDSSQQLASERDEGCRLSNGDAPGRSKVQTLTGGH